MTTTSDPVTTLAALDIGTNSFHLVVARLLDNGFEIVTREKETVRLGHGGGDMKELSADAIDRGISSLRRMQRIAASHDATVRAVATSAVREARQRRRVPDTGAPRGQGRHRGDLRAGGSPADPPRRAAGGPCFDQRLILVDIGGGSTEVLVGERGETLAARSFKLGAVRLTDRFFPGGTISDESVQRLPLVRPLDPGDVRARGRGASASTWPSPRRAPPRRSPG